MKRILLITALILIFLTGCANSTELENTNESNVSKTHIAESQIEQTESDEPSNTTESNAAASSFSASKETENSASATTETQVPQNTQKPVKDESKETVSNSTDTQTTSTTTETTSSETEPSSETTVTQTPTRPDAKEVEKKVAEYINQLRVAQGDTETIILPGLTAVAEYRANQLISNFAHDTADQRTALAYYQYGEYVDMTLYGGDESDNYYCGYNREAIGKGNWGGTANEIAKKIAEGVKNSSNHWRYVGSSEYGYMAVGVVYHPATSSWYVCICMSSKDYGG